MNIGIDIGGSHIGVGIVNNDGTIKKMEEIYISSNSEDNIVSYIQSFIITVLRKWIDDDNIKIDKIGIGVPGEIINNEVITCVNLGIRNYNFKEEIQKNFPFCQIRLENDARCAGLTEKNIGAIKDFDNAIFMCLGTGVGSAIFKNGILVESEKHIGHMTLKENGELCNCGNRGCFERYASMRLFKTKVRIALGVDGKVDGEQLINTLKANINSPIIKKVVSEYIEDVCQGLSMVINKYQPDAICIGGGFVKYSELLYNRIITGLENKKSQNKINYIPKVVVAKYGNDAGMIGSALFI